MKKLNQELEKRNFELAVPQKPGYPDGTSYGKILIEKIDWMDNHFGLLPEGYDSIFEIDEESVLKGIIRKYHEHKLFLMFDTQQSGIYSAALKNLKIYRGFEPPTQQLGLIYSAPKPVVKTLHSSQSVSHVKNVKPHTKSLQEWKRIKSIQHSCKVEERKRKHALDVLRKVEDAKKALERQSIAYQKASLAEAENRKKKLEAYLKRMNGRPVTNEDIQRIKDAPLYLKYEQARYKSEDKEKKKREHAITVLENVKAQEQLQRIETQNYWRKKAEYSFFKKCSKSVPFSPEWEYYADVSLKSCKDAYEKFEYTWKQKKMWLQNFPQLKSKKINLVAENQKELEKLESRSRFKSQKEEIKIRRRREKLKGRIKRNQKTLIQLDKTYQSLSTELESLKFERLRITYQYESWKYLCQNKSPYSQTIHKRKINQCILFLSKSDAEQLNLLQSIIESKEQKKKENEKARKKRQTAHPKVKKPQKVTPSNDKSDFIQDSVKEPLETSSKLKTIQNNFSDKNNPQNPVIQASILCLSNQVIHAKSHKSIKETLCQNEENIIELSYQKHNTIVATTSNNYLKWCQNASRLKAIEAAIEIESNNLLKENSPTIHLSNNLLYPSYESFSFFSLRCAESSEFYDYIDELNYHYYLYSKLYAGLSWDDFLNFLDSYCV